MMHYRSALIFFIFCLTFVLCESSQDKEASQEDVSYITKRDIEEASQNAAHLFARAIEDVQHFVKRQQGAAVAATATAGANSIVQSVLGNTGGIANFVMNMIQNLFQFVTRLIPGGIGAMFSRVINTFLSTPGSIFQRIFAAIRAIFSGAATVPTRVKRRLHERDLGQDNSVQELLRRFLDFEDNGLSMEKRADIRKRKIENLVKRAEESLGIHHE